MVILNNNEQDRFFLRRNERCDCLVDSVYSAKWAIIYWAVNEVLEPVVGSDVMFSPAYLIIVMSVTFLSQWKLPTPSINQACLQSAVQIKIRIQFTTRLMVCIGLQISVDIVLCIITFYKVTWRQISQLGLTPRCQQWNINTLCHNLHTMIQGQYQRFK